MNHYVCIWRRLLPNVVLCIAVAVFTLTIVPGAQPAERKVSVIGSSRIYEDVTNARNAALEEGLLSAVELVALDIIPQQCLKENFEVISEILYSHREDFTQGFQVLKEINTGSYYHLLIRSTVSADKIMSMIRETGVFETSEKLPRLLLLVAEKDTGQPSFRYWWQAPENGFKQTPAVEAIQNIMRKQGYPVIQPQALDRDQILAGLPPKAGLSADEAITLGMRADAQVVIFGKARAEPISNRMESKLKSVKGIISLSAVTVGSREPVTSLEKTATAADPDLREACREVLSNVGRLAGEALSERISQAWQDQARQTEQLEIHVKGKGNILKHLVGFRKVLRQTSGVTRFQTRSLSGNEALLVLDYEGSARQLADQLVLTPFEGFGIDIYELTGTMIRVKLISDKTITETELTPN